MKPFKTQVFLQREHILKDQTSIESVEAFGLNLYVGTSNAYILHYMMSIDYIELPLNKPLAQLVLNKKLKKVAKQIVVSPILNQLILNCDGNLVMLNMESFSIISSTSNKFKNIKELQVNKTPLGNDYLCVEVCVSFVKKKTLQLLQLYENKIIPFREISLAHQIETFAVDYNSAIVCSQEGYFIVYFDSGHKQEVIKFNSNQEKEKGPFLLKSFEKSEFFIDYGDVEIGMFISSEGQPLGNKPVIPDFKCIFKACMAHPYVFALSSNKIVIYNVLDKQDCKKQVEVFHGGKMLTSLDDGSVLVCTEKDIFILIQIPLQDQINDLVSKSLVDEAIKVLQGSRCKIPKDKFVQLITRVNCVAGFVKFQQFKFEDCNKFFKEGKLNPQEFIILFPKLLRSSSLFTKADPPLHSIESVELMCKNDKTKILACRGCLDLYLRDVLSSMCSINLENENDLYKYLDLSFAYIINLTILKKKEKLIQFTTFVSAPVIAKLLNEANKSGFVAKLQENECYHCLALMYLKVGMLQDALEIWRSICEKKIQDSEFPGLKFVSQKLSACCTNKQVFLMNAGWMLKIDEVTAVQCFIEINTNLIKLCPDEIVDFISKYHEALFVYLQYLVLVANTNKEKFHTHLVSMYFEKLLQLVNSDDVDSKDLVKVQKELHVILNHSDLYRANLILGKVEGHGLYKEEVILHRKLKQHRKALNLIVNKLNEKDTAEVYCKSYNTDSNKLFESLLEIYLKNLEEDSTYTKVISRFLNKNAKYLNFEFVLNLLPSHWSVNSLLKFLQNRTYNQLYNVKTKSLECEIEKLHILQLNKELLCIEKKPIFLHEGRLCSFCNELLTKEAVVSYPNGVIVHLRCSKSKTVCPVTGKCFS